MLQDFEGQRLAELLTTILLSISGVIAFFAGFVTQNIFQTLYIGLGGTALTFLVVVPPWPFYNQHPLPWLPARSARATVTREAVDLQGVEIEVDGKRIG